MMFKAVLIVAALALLTTSAFPKSGLIRELSGTTFSISDYETDFLSAFVTCNGLGLELASVLNETEEAALNNTIPTDNIYWLGAVYEQTQVFKAKWIWISSWEPVVYSNWDEGEPAPGTSRFCMARDTTGYWVTLPCTVQHYFLCQNRH